MDPIDSTVSTHLIRLVRDAARRAGVAQEQLAAIHGTDEETLTGELNRIPLTSLVRLWELLAHARPQPGAGVAVVDAAPLGALNTWDYLVTTGATLTEALRSAQPYHRLVTAAGEAFTLDGDGDLTVGFGTSAGDPRVVSILNEYVLAYYLRRAREATGRPVRPTLVTFSSPAPQQHSILSDAFDTNRIEFGATADTIVFDAADATAPLIRPDPTLAGLLRGHADLVLATAKPIPGPTDAFRIALAAALESGDLTIDAVARRLLLSRRSLQRRLAEQGTNWRHEVDLIRHEQAKHLLAQGRSTAAVATHLGFADDRALRKAFHRWNGTSPTGH